MSDQTLTVPASPTAQVQEKSNAGRPPKYPEPPTYDQLTMIDQQVVDYFAMDGLMPNDGSNPEKKGTLVQVSAQKFAERLGYSNRQSLYDRREAIPNFDGLVLARMKPLYRRYMVPAAWKGVGLRSMRGDAKQAEMLLSHYDTYVPPAQRHEIKIDGLAEAVNAARAARRLTNPAPIEAKVVEKAPELSTFTPQIGDKVVVAPTPPAAVVDTTPPAPAAPVGVESKPTPELVAIAPANVNKPAGNVMPMETPPAVNVNPPEVAKTLQNENPADKSVDEFGDPIRTLGDF